MSTTHTVTAPFGDIRVTISDSEYVGKYESGNNWEHYAYTAWITYQGRTLRTGYSQGTAHTTDQVDPTDILWSIALDANSADQSFEDFCADLGYDSALISSLRTYEACERMWHSIKRVFGRQVRAFYEYAEALAK